MLEIPDLSKTYGSVVALDGASFTVRPGRLVGFLGPNGAGKTTTMRCIFGLARAGPRHDHLARQADRAGRPPPLRLHARAARALPADEGRRAARLLRRAARPVGAGARAPPTARWLDGLGPRPTGRARSSRRSPTATSSGSSSARRSSTTRSCSSSTSRSAASTRSASTTMSDDPPPAGRGRRRGRLLEPPARPRRGRLRGRRDHQPRPDRRRRRDRRAARGVDAAAISRSRSRATPTAGSTAAPDLTVEDGADDLVRLVVAGGRRPRRRCSRPASAAGPVRRFAFQPPTLSELFMEVVRS